MFLSLSSCTLCLLNSSCCGQSIQFDATVIWIRPDFHNVNQILLQLNHHAAIDAALEAVLGQQLWLSIDQLMMLQSFVVRR